MGVGVRGPRRLGAQRAGGDGALQVESAGPREKVKRSGESFGLAA